MNNMIDTLTTPPIELLGLCALFGALGGVCNILILSINATSLPVRKPVETWKSRRLFSGGRKLILFVWHALVETISIAVHTFYCIPKWVVFRLMISVITGIFIGLLFADILDKVPEGKMRVYALSLALGYMAPNFWLVKEKLILNLLESNAIQGYVQSIVNNAFTKMQDEAPTETRDTEETNRG